MRASKAALWAAFLPAVSLLTAEAFRLAFRRYDTPERRFSLCAVPTNPADADSASQPEPEVSALR